MAPPSQNIHTAHPNTIKKEKPATLLRFINNILPMSIPVILKIKDGKETSVEE